MKELMIDLETLGTGQNSVFLSLAAVQFSLDGRVGAKFYMNIEKESALRAGLQVDQKTLDWWATQRPEIMAKMFENARPINMVLAAFREWYKSVGVTRPWGNSASFDLGILGNGYNRVGIAQPWALYNEMCFRTIMNLNGGKPTSIIKDNTKAHDPIYDCEYQIKCLVHALKGGSAK